MGGRQILEDAAEGLKIADKLGAADVFAFCEDGSIYRLENMKVRPPMTARVVEKQAFLDWLNR